MQFCTFTSSIIAFLLLLSSSSSLLSVHSQSIPVQFQNGTLCDRYTNALSAVVGGTQSSVTAEINLITAIVTRIVLGGSANGIVVPGLVAPNSPLLPVFQGAVPFRANPINYTDPSQAAALTRLTNHLVTFFGNAFGCTAPGFPPTPTYVTMRRVHAGMGVNAVGLAYFITQAGLTLQSFGVDPLDISTIAVPYLNMFGLCGGDNQICEDPSCPLATRTYDQQCVAQSDYMNYGLADHSTTINNYTMVTGFVIVIVFFLILAFAECIQRKFRYHKV